MKLDRDGTVTLEVSHASRRDAGTYTCAVTNEVLIKPLGSLIISVFYGLLIERTDLGFFVVLSIIWLFFF